MSATSFSEAVDSGLLTDAELRDRVRLTLGSIVDDFQSLGVEQQQQNLVEFAQGLRDKPISPCPQDEMYEIPTEFFKLMLGSRLKFSSYYYAESSYTMDQAEEAMLELYIERAQLKDGQSILDLGGGWGALSILVAEKFPSCQVTTISSSKSLKAHIDKECHSRCLTNVKAVECDISTAELDGTYDWIFCIGLLEHLKNYAKFLKKVSAWLKPEGLFFVEVLTHKQISHQHEDLEDDGLLSWMAKYVPGVTIPADPVLLYFQEDLSVVNHWILNGSHYGKTCNSFVQKMDQNMELILPIIASAVGEGKEKDWIIKWRTFWIILSEMFSFKDGQVWVISQFLFRGKPRRLAA